MKRKNRKILITVGIAAILAVILFLNQNNIIRLIYFNRFFDGPPMDTKKKHLALPKIIDFKFTLADAEFINAFSNTIVPAGNQWRIVPMAVNGNNFAVEISRFNNYFKNIRLNDINRSISLRFPRKNYHQRMRRFDLFQVDKIDLFEQELIYKFARELGIYVPHTEFVAVRVHNVPEGISFFKQAYDDIFLSMNKLPDSIIFMMGKGKDGRWRLDYLYNKYDIAEDAHIFEHLNNFFKQLDAGDPNLLLKYFDIDYIARFETLRQLLGVGSGFLMEDNVKIIYNPFNGRFYPILDESNLYNMQVGKKNKHFRPVARQIKKSPVTPLIERKKNGYMNGLANSYSRLFSHYQTLKKQYTYRGSENFHNKLRIKLIARYFENNVFPKLERGKFGTQSPKTGETGKTGETSGAGFEFYLNAKPGGESRFPGYKPLPASYDYLDHMLLDPGRVKEKYRYLNLQVTNDKRIRLKRGNYNVRENVFVPMGYLLEIEAGTTIRMSPGVSLVSYSPLRILGTRQNPVVIKSLKKEKPFGVWAVVGMGDKNNAESVSIVEHLDFSGGSRVFVAGCNFPGGLNFHNMGVEIRSSLIHHNHGHDALNIKRGMVALENNLFYANPVDHAALDFCKGVVTGNRFIDDTEDREGDGLDLSGSECFVTGNLFAQFLDKGLSIGEESICFLYNNVIRQNRIGIAAKNRARVLVMDNKCYDNTHAVAAYQKKTMFGGGHVYLLGNDFRGNDRLYKIDKDSKIYKLENTENYKKEFDRMIAAKELGGIFDAVDGIIDKYTYKDNRIDSFYIGGRKVEVDERNKVIFAVLPPGSDTNQRIRCKPGLEKADVYIKPIRCGIKTLGRDKNRELKLKRDQYFDFQGYIFYGKIILEHNYQRDEYDFYVTTGTLPVVEIDTSGVHGIPRIIKNEPKIPCKIRIFSNTGAAHRTGNKYINKILDGKIEGRGKKLPKWKYGVTLEDSYTLEGMIDSKRWVLESSFIEKSLMRSKVAFDLLEQFREDKKRRRIAPQSRFVEVILNGSYHGVYLLTEHINKHFLGLETYEKNKAFNSVLYRARNINANFSPFNAKSFYKKDYKYFPGRRQPLDKGRDPIWGWRSGFEQRYPHKKKHGEIWKPIEDFSRFAGLAPDGEFRKRIFQLLDRDSYIDLWVFTQLVDDSDGLYKNRYLARHRGRDARWYIIPWDKDGILGRKHNMEKRSHKKWLTTHLFERCMQIDSFRNAFKTRWNELVSKGIISEENISRMTGQNINLLTDAQKRNFKRWPVNYYRYPDPDDFGKETGYLQEWIQKRIKWLNKRINGDNS
ncbi:MAG: hypothetical protein GY950_36400 [bacterium]|nr:hypothetical protein [bacterium]